jgi:hypothetical protein
LNLLERRFGDANNPTFVVISFGENRRLLVSFGTGNNGPLPNPFNQTN